MAQTSTGKGVGCEFWPRSFAGQTGPGQYPPLSALGQCCIGATGSIDLTENAGEQAMADFKAQRLAL
jgi:hypothetical protein